ncbi:MAG TPA: glycosyltransferase [Solirubrobacteraceae bacterium]|nr:glycosyltransferase [Solirubrobacteraceae bacterium]
MPARPTASVIVPFTGDETALIALVTRLGALRRGPGDELIIADNRRGASAKLAAHGVRIHPAGGVATPAFARNRGAAAAMGEWLVFLDADTLPGPDHLDALLHPAPDPSTAILAGAILDVPPSDGVSRVAAHLLRRGHMSDQVTLGRPDHPYAQSANLAVRRDAFVRVGGFVEHARAGEDADLCFRLREAGWGLEARPRARVGHLTRAALGDLLLQLVRHGAGAAWCDRRHPGSFPAAGALGISRRLAHDLRLALSAWARGDRAGALDPCLDMLEAGAFSLGRRLPNRPRWRVRSLAPGA